MSDKHYARILVTAALPYANGPLHLGHMAGAYLPADIYCRYQRLMGRDVVFICGSDEHGVPIILRARQDGVSPQAIVDRYHAMLQGGFAAFGMSFDHYGRTSSPTQRETSQQFFRAMAQKNAFVLKQESQLYDPEAQMFLADRFVRGTCPTCGNPDAYGDQCERCGRTLSPKELIEPRSAVTQARPELRETTHWYLPLGAQQGWLETWLDSHPDWKANVVGQAKSWLKEGLADRSMTRDLPWGVPVPEDVARAAGVDARGKVLYVWFDAPIGYISATREWAAQQGDPERWRAYWQDAETKLVHFIGKDNIVFHTLIFPAMLRLHGGYVLPENVPANEFLNLEGQKLSTSRNWAVWVHEALEAFPADYLRYALLGILPEAKDADFSWKEFQARVNNELADTLGNFVNRTVVFAKRFHDGRVPPFRGEDALEAGTPAAFQAKLIDPGMKQAIAEATRRVGEAIEQYRIREAGSAVMELARAGNKYFNDTKPWGPDLKSRDNTIHTALNLCASLSILCEPFLPITAKRIRSMLKLNGVRSSERAGGAGLSWTDASRFLLEVGHVLGEPEILFVKIEDAAIQAQLDKLYAGRPAATAGGADAAAAEQKPYEPLHATIEYDDFAKLDLRVALVVSAEPVPKSKKLLRCQVDLGFEQRQVLAGVAEHMTPEQLIGKKLVLVANLAPRTMLGLESQGMLLMAKNRDGKLVPVAAEGEPGATVA